MKHDEQRRQIEQTILESVDAFYEDYHRSPTVRELSKRTGLSLGSISKYVNRMSERGHLLFDGREIVTERSMKFRPECVYAGLLGSVQCGTPTEAEEQIEDYYPLPRDLFGKGPLYLLRAEGYSMTGADIHDGDLVVIRKTEDVHEGQIVVAWIEGEGATLKRLIRKDGKMLLHPENPDYDDLPAEGALIQGVAVQVIRDVK